MTIQGKTGHHREAADRAFATASRLPSAVDQLIRQIVPGAGQLRMEERRPFCYPATLHLKEWAGLRMPAYVRDISRGGMGFTHATPLELGDVVAKFRLPDGTDVQLHVCILWTRRLNDDWFISGGRFVDSAGRGNRWRRFRSRQVPLVAAGAFVALAMAWTWLVLC